MPEPEDSMRYMCLIYDNEQTWAKMSKPEADAVMGEYFAFPRTSGARPLPGGEALQAVSTATTVRVRDGKLSTTDGPIRGDEEASGRVLPERCEGPERGHSDCLAHPLRPVRAPWRSAGRRVQSLSRHGRARDR